MSNHDGGVWLLTFPTGTHEYHLEYGISYGELWLINDTNDHTGHVQIATNNARTFTIDAYSYTHHGGLQLHSPDYGVSSSEDYLTLWYLDNSGSGWKNL